MIKENQEDLDYAYRKKYKFWFCTGSQDLYGDECLRKVAVTEGDKVEAQIKFG